jgi:hypothetical protein
MNYNHVTECRGIIGLLHKVVRAYFPIVMTINIGTVQLSLDVRVGWTEAGL